MDRQRAERILRGLQRQEKYDAAQAQVRTIRAQKTTALGKEIMARRLQRPRFEVEFEGTDDECLVPAVDKSTNWNGPGGTRRVPRPNMMGQGLGRTIGWWPSKARPEIGTPAAVEVIDEAQEKARVKKKRQLAREKAEVDVFVHAILRKKAEEEGRVLKGQRVYHLQYLRENFDLRSEKLGIAIPEGVDVAQTEFGGLIVIPVIEEAEGTELALDRKNGFKDAEGRFFWVAAHIRDVVVKVFGIVNWKRPLTLREVEQFGVSWL